VLPLIRSIGPEVHSIYCIDDECPEGSGDLVERECPDSRVKVIRHTENAGVGAATFTGYRAAVNDGADVIVKLDGDGQMDPSLLRYFVLPILAGQADYVKGNRFYYLEHSRGMPRLRLFGNTALSFMTKVSSGYWDVFDPTNGYTAIHGAVARLIIERPVATRFFFESDMLFHLNLARAVVVDVPIEAHYGFESSNLSIGGAIVPFTFKHMRNTVRRITVQYFVRDFSLASVNLLSGLLASLFGCVYGVYGWVNSSIGEQPATAGTVMVAALPIIVGVQLLLSFLSYDIQNVPRHPLHPRLAEPARPTH